ncbi:MAG: hypothetical protein AAB955_02975 [Patescibacteria group bacterium]
MANIEKGMQRAVVGSMYLLFAVLTLGGGYAGGYLGGGFRDGEIDVWTVAAAIAGAGIGGFAGERFLNFAGPKLDRHWPWIS